MDIRTGTAPSGDLELYYEDMGDPNDPAILLIMGLGAQLLLWRKGFCEKLVAQGYRVIRYDNRDAGLSTKLDGVRAVGSMLPKLARSFLVGGKGVAHYTLEDMADDAAALLDHLDISRAHIVGASMGGMIAQVFAARHADRTAGLGIFFSSNNRRLLPPPAPRALLAVVKSPPAGSPRERIVDEAVRARRVIGSPAYPAPAALLRADAEEAYDRCYYPEGIARQFDAILASGSLDDYDKQITAPTVVIHGLADKLMRPAGGRAIASAIPRARLVLLDGMGHELPEELWDQVVSELKNTFAEASDQRR
ncbi:MAG: lipG1 [Mycobacterium sp.]|nr:lipG1 [Mycobacterium sp.]